MTHSYGCAYWAKGTCNCGLLGADQALMAGDLTGPEQMAQRALAETGGNAYEGVGTLVIFQYRENSNVMAHPLRVEDVLYDTVTTEKGILVVEDEKGEVVHVPNVAYYKVEPKV